jgi:hypothetical protein
LAVKPDPFDDDEAFMKAFSDEQILYGINQFAEIKLGMSGDDFISKVRAGEPVNHLHKRAQEVADLVGILDRRHADN